MFQVTQALENRAQPQSAEGNGDEAYGGLALPSQPFQISLGCPRATGFGNPGRQEEKE